MSTLDEFFLFNDPKSWKDGQRKNFYDKCTRLLDENYVKDGFYEYYK